MQRTLLAHVKLYAKHHGFAVLRGFTAPHTSIVYFPKIGNILEALRLDFGLTFRKAVSPRQGAPGFGGDC